MESLGLSSSLTIEEWLLPQSKKPLSERILEAEWLASKAVADANEHAEAGRHEKAQRLFAKAQFWHDRWILLTGHGDRPAPKR